MATIKQFILIFSPFLSYFDVVYTETLVYTLETLIYMCVVVDCVQFIALTKNENYSG